MSDITLISAAEAYEHRRSGQALLVCAYDSDEKFRTYQLEGAIPLSALTTRLDSVDKDQEIIFYCN
ncbi:MAG: ArsR family transcriptional regulator [Desulfofustis sp.]|nr:ArsR family transcriptional regulator [Desulfofustis sp.]